MTQDQIDQHSTGPAYLPYQRMGKLREWGGPLPKSWHQLQTEIQKTITTYMIDLGMVPVFPTFNAHVSRELFDLFSWKSMKINKFWSTYTAEKHCCDMFVDPEDPLFERIGKMFLNEITSDFDDRAVLIVQNTMWNSESSRWADHIVESVLTAVSKGRMIILDTMLQKDLNNKTCTLFHGQPYIWIVDTQKLNWDMYEAIDPPYNTIVGLGVSPSVMEQNYMLVEWVLEAAWRSKRPSLPEWQQQYASRRYGCNATASAWGHLLNSVYKGNMDIYTIISWPSQPLYNVYSRFPKYELLEAWRKFVFVPDDECRSPAFEYNLIDVTRHALHYRALQVYMSLRNNDAMVPAATTRHVVGRRAEQRALDCR
ncbi:alpha-N-acetylglucosaminidase-like [Hyposmocoma kahamanoa]|uniref:alpha-N-acetylglucosaminidase-like n=1 Tax=Hyposmocoma kahamanoa TaxID=1477025 RepID=UPI000E6D61FE|nr:alpha-N-acetylglucosaminidase-like [Hyposmocoma kahamanoa]